MRSRVVRLLSVLSVLVAALALIRAGIAPAQQQAARPGLDALAVLLYQELAAIRGVPAPGSPPPIEIKSREQTRRFIEQELDRRYSPARVESERKGMVAWGLIPAGYDLRRLFVDLMEEQIAAYYDPRSKVMVVGDWLAPEQQQAALMHELVHALQDREISLDAFITPHPGQGDQLLARQALIEGEAVALTLELLLKKQGAELASLPDVGPVRQMVAAGSTGAAIAGAPKFLRDLLLFPYVDGLDFVYQFRKRHPWSAMTTLYRDPPRSTTQILNPGKRLDAREDPIPVTLPDLAPLLSDARVVAEDELGEFALGAVLGRHLGEQAGRRAVAGWRGDHYRIWEDRNGRSMIAYLVAMESTRVANAFALAYAKVLEQRHPAVAGKAVAAAAPTHVGWQEAGRSFAVDARGGEVLVLEQVPAALAERIRETIWRSRSAAMPTLDHRQRAAVASPYAE